MEYSSLPGVSVAEDLILLPTPQYGTAVPVFIGYTDANVLATGELKLIYSLDDSLTPSPDSASLLPQALHFYFINGGEPCFVLSAGDEANIPNTDANIAHDLKAALCSPALASEDRIRLLAIPDLALLAATTSWREVMQAMLDYCSLRRDVFALLDLPADDNNVITALKDNFDNDEWGAAYWPHLRIQPAGQTDWHRIPPSAAVASMIQRSDRKHGVWKAPANDAMPALAQPEYQPQDVDMLALTRPFNWICVFPQRGTRLWGCRTLSPIPHGPGSYVQVRRLLSYIETNLSGLTKFCVFEPNNEISWLKLRGLSSIFLRRLWKHGGLHGLREEDAFRVQIGLNESMTADDIAAGRVIMNVAVAALCPAEFIDITLKFYVMDSADQAISQGS